VTKQVIERHLVDTLPSTILSPMVVAGLTDEEISFVAAEPADVTQQRAYYEAKKEMLEKGVSAFRKAMGGP
jgi:CRISPR/Cas system-associated protein Csm6